MLPTLCVLRGIGSDFRKKYRANPAVILPPSLEMCSSISLAPLCKACRHRLRTVQAVLWLMGPMKWTICFVIRNPSNKRKNRACLVSSRGAETPAYSTSPRRTVVTGSAATVSRIRPRRHHQRHVVILRRIGDTEGEGDFVDEAGGGQGDALGGEIIAGGEHQFVAAGAQGVAFQQRGGAAAVGVGDVLLQQAAFADGDGVQLDAHARAGGAAGGVEDVGAEFAHGRSNQVVEALYAGVSPLTSRPCGLVGPTRRLDEHGDWHLLPVPGSSRRLNTRNRQRVPVPPFGLCLG